ncbi:S1C family serine protease [Thermoactinomyces mirandus]|uniref:Trypsin-like peptidase domain-containing protein n=1 Tax=Thermoactinomyces mirandus TaxID=2756294 RepID=A0A7W1XQT7_9BACL|nr:trypsin-like peptidase domain-containing protein [Thermoactinomyces mirandus]MBA4601501.1 trypsin-like peptidase domain-containing protein [Thermoactinomyces mirandus]
MSHRKIQAHRLSVAQATQHPANVFVSVYRHIRRGIASIMTEESKPQPYVPIPRNLFSLFVPEQRKLAQVRNHFGSGFVINSKGYILTNEHVIKNASRIQVKLDHYKKSLTGVPVWADRQKDLAIIKVKTPRPLPALQLGTSRNTQVGEWVLAVGNPFGLEQTVTAGIISGKNRPLKVGGRYYENVIQTDAAINPGNSGGPLVNIFGKVIGMNTLIIYPSQCIGFAIPIEDIRPHIEPYLSG